MTKEEFYHIAENKPEVTLPTVYKLIVYSYNKDIKHYRKNGRIGDWYLTLSTVNNLYSSKESAEKALLSHINSHKDRWGHIHHALIQRIYLDEKVNESSIVQWWLYDANGDEIDHSVCADVVKDEMDIHEVFFGRNPEEIRLKPGDIVEYLSNDNKVYLTVLNDTPPSRERMWEGYEDAVKRCGPQEDGVYEEPYFIGAMRDMYYYIRSDGFDPDAPVYCFFKPLLPLPEKAKEELTSRYKRWKANVGDAISGKITWEQLEKIVSSK